MGNNIIKNFAIVLILCALACGVFAQWGYIPQPSATKVYHTGTIPVSELKKAQSVYENFGCHRIDYFIVEKGYVNVYCLEFIIGE